MDYHVRHSALPKPGRVRAGAARACLATALHADGHRAAAVGVAPDRGPPRRPDGDVREDAPRLNDGVSANRLPQSILTTDPDRRDLPAPWAKHPPAKTARAQEAAEQSLETVPVSTLKQALGVASDAAGIPKALLTTLTKSLRNETSALSLYAPRTILNQKITGSRRFAAQSWPIDGCAPSASQRHDHQRRGPGDVQWCHPQLPDGAGRAAARHDADLDGPSMGSRPRSRRSRRPRAATPWSTVMVKLGTDLPDPADRLAMVQTRRCATARTLSAMTPLQILAMSAIGQAPAVLPTML
ncbi:MAG: wax ester/triacylglycerol synthase family O-acyltransferase [Nocardioides sp.]